MFRAAILPLPIKNKPQARSNREGKVFGRLTVFEDLGPDGNGNRWWGCQCECGTKVAVRSRELDRGHTQSCGCLKREVLSKSGGHNRLATGVASGNELLAAYKKSARKRGIEWGLSSAEFFELVSDNCSYCGTPPNKVRKPNAGVNGGFVYSGIDRIDSTLGYVKGNVCSCCWDCNRAKGTLPLADFLAWIDRFNLARGARFEHGESGARRG